MSQPTEQQQAAIEAKGAVLLSAGAGTGKTATLVNRCLRLVTDEGVDVDRLLVVTFTNAAAAEMKQRLREALRDRAAERPDDERLRRQLLLLEGAHISTIHSFCLELVRAHFAELELDPGVSVLDESVAAPLAQKLALETVRGAIAVAETQELVKQYAGGRGESLADLVLGTYRFFVTQPQADALLARELERYAEPAPTYWRGCRPKIIAEWLSESAPTVQARIRLALQILTKSPYYGAENITGKAICRIETLLTGFAEQLTALGQCPDEPSVVALLRRARELGSKDVWVRNTGKAKAPLSDFFEEAAQLDGWLPDGNSDPLDGEWARVRAPVRKLLELTRTFWDAFTRAKRALGGVDFADLEQMALRLLIDGDGRPTPVAIEWREWLDHVFVDECQDVNAAQDALLQAVARENERANLFMVGDVKQSIYRFRMAAPELFRRHAESWPGREHHQVLPLTENFRSREGLLAFANSLFDCLMRPRLGGVGYGDAERLAFGLPGARPGLSVHPPAGEGPSGEWSEADCRVELHLVREEKKGAAPDESETREDGWDDLMGLERQAHVAGVRLHELHQGGHQVWDKRDKRFRPMQWSDVGLLMRSVRGRSSAFIREFARMGIPLAVEQGDFLETLEASDLAAVLRILDNPRQDIPLFAVLRSPLAGWTLEELVSLRCCGAKGECGWDQLLALSRHPAQDPATLKAIGFVESLLRWRRLALMTSPSVVFETILTETKYEAWLLTLPDGADRVANVRRFLDLARRFDPLQRQGLFRFLGFLDNQADADRQIEPLPPRQADAVQLLSVHKSKGLEFPVVVLAGIGAGFRYPDLKGSILFSRAWGVAPQVVDLVAHQRQESLVLWQTKREEKLASLAEELRLVYVAITRARDTLLLLGSFNPDGDKWQARTSLPLELGVAEAKSYCEWIALWLGNCVDWGAEAGEVSFPVENPLARLRWRTYGGAISSGGIPVSQVPQMDAPPLLTEAQVQGFAWKYPHDAATRTPAKTSASALRRLSAAPDDEAAPAWPLHRAFRSAPQAATSGRLSPTEIGTAHHRFLQSLDITRAGSMEGLAAELERLGARVVLSPAEVAAVDLSAVLEFWTSPMGQGIREQVGNVHRELTFTAAFAPAELPPFADRFIGVPGDEFVVVQGAVDLAVLLPGEVWIVDFKTDHVTEAELPDRAREHERQLRLYAAALQRTYGRPVTRCQLYFLALRRGWDVADPLGEKAVVRPAAAAPAAPSP